MSLGISLQKLADETGLSPSTLRRVLTEAGVSRKQVGKALLFDRGEVEDVLGFSDDAPARPAPSPPSVLSREEAEKIKKFMGR